MTNLQSEDLFPSSPQLPDMSSTLDLIFTSTYSPIPSSFFHAGPLEETTSYSKSFVFV